MWGVGQAQGVSWSAATLACASPRAAPLMIAKILHDSRVVNSLLATYDRGRLNACVFIIELFTACSRIARGVSRVLFSPARHSHIASR